MTWLALSDRQKDFLDVSRLRKVFHRAGGGDALLVRGTLSMEFTLPDSHDKEPLLFFETQGRWPSQLAVQAHPGGRLQLLLRQSGQVKQALLSPARAERSEVLRLVYSWDSPSCVGHLALEHGEGGRVHMQPIVSPCPWRLRDLAALIASEGSTVLSPLVRNLALSSRVEPIGPAPSLTMGTPIATPEGYRRAAGIKRGDLVLTPEGVSVPVLHVLHRQVPALGMNAPIQLRRPYFGLQQDIEIAPHQRLIISGTEVEYLFGKPSVLAPACHFRGTPAARPTEHRPVAEYVQFLLPDQASLLVAGIPLESLYLGSLRRNASLLNASQLSGYGKAALPEHGPPRYPVLRAFDAAVLAERRVA